MDNLVPSPLSSSNSSGVLRYIVSTNPGNEMTSLHVENFPYELVILYTEVNLNLLEGTVKDT